MSRAASGDCTCAPMAMTRPSAALFCGLQRVSWSKAPTAEARSSELVNTSMKPSV